MSSKTNETVHETESEITHATLSAVFSCVNSALAKKDEEILRLKAELAKIKTEKDKEIDHLSRVVSHVKGNHSAQFRSLRRIYGKYEIVANDLVTFYENETGHSVPTTALEFCEKRFEEDFNKISTDGEFVVSDISPFV